MDSQNPSQEQHSQQNRRRLGEAAGGGGSGQNQLPHPPPQACPRCNSNNTKFCYYNNYSLAQPRYFCKGCRRYWTQGGTLRTVPVGGGSRKRKRVSNNKTATSSSAAATTSTVIGGHCSSSMEQQQPPFNFELTGSTSLLFHHSGQNLHPPTSLLGTVPINNNTGTLIYGGAGGGGGGGGFFSSLAGFPPVSFGPNLGLLNGLGLPSLDHHHNGTPQHQEEPISFQQLLQQHHNQNLHPGSISSISGPPVFSSDWINKTENNNDDPNHWPDFEVGNNDGLEDP